MTELIINIQRDTKQKEIASGPVSIKFRQPTEINSRKICAKLKSGKKT